MRIAIEQLTKRFEATLVLDRVNLEIGEREFIGLLGPSGSGKTTLLRILAGLEFADEGRVLFDGKEAQALPIADRQVGMVFQHYALYEARVSEFVFPGARAGTHLARAALRKALERVGVDGTGYGFRSSFRRLGVRDRELPARGLRAGARAHRAFLETPMSCGL